MRSITNYSVQVTCVVFTQRLCLSSLKTDNKNDETLQALHEKGNTIEIAEMVDDEEFFKVKLNFAQLLIILFYKRTQSYIHNTT